MDIVRNFWKNKLARNWGIGIFSIILLFFVIRGFSGVNSRASLPSMETQVVSIDVAETIETSGALQAQPFASLTWKTSGVVESINVQPGDFVKAGDILLALQPESTSG